MVADWVPPEVAKWVPPEVGKSPSGLGGSLVADPDSFMGVAEGDWQERVRLPMGGPKPRAAAPARAPGAPERPSDPSPAARKIAATVPELVDFVLGFPYFIAQATSKGVADLAALFSGEKKPVKAGSETIDSASQSAWNRFLSSPLHAATGFDEGGHLGDVSQKLEGYKEKIKSYVTEKVGSDEAGEATGQLIDVLMAGLPSVAGRMGKISPKAAKGTQEGVEAKMEEWAKKAEEAPPEAPPPKAQRADKSAVAKAVDALGLEKEAWKFGAIAGIGAGIYAAADDKDKALAAIIPFAAAMKQAEPHIPPALRPSFERAKLGDVDALHHLDMLRMDLPKEQRVLLDPAIKSLEDVHFGDKAGILVPNVFPPRDGKKDESVLPLAVMLKMSEGTPLGVLHKGLRYTTGALAALARELPNRFEISKEQIESVLGRQGVVQAEKDLIRGVVGDRAAISAKDLVTGVRAATGDFELTPKGSREHARYGLENIRPGLEHDSGGWSPDVTQASARTTIYQSPIQLGPTKHFSDPKYFAHTRSFDEGGVRHVVEIQSDVAQTAGKQLTPDERIALGEEATRARVELRNTRRLRDGYTLDDPKRAELSAKVRELEVRTAELDAKVSGDLKVEPVRPILKDWWKRIVREEVGQASEAYRGRLREESEIRESMRLQREHGDLEEVARLQRMLDNREWGGVAGASPAEVMRFATADTVAKVEGWPKTDWAREVELYKVSIRRLEAAGKERIADNPLYQKELWNLAHAEEMLGKFGPGEMLERAEHQSIYDRYRREIEKFLKSEYKARPYTDPHGHTWLEIDLPKIDKPISMFGQGGKVQTDLLIAMGLGGVAIASAVGLKNLQPDLDWSQAIFRGAGAVALAAIAPRYAKYLKDNYGALARTSDVVGVLGQSLLAGTLAHDPIAGAAVALGLMAWKSSPKALDSPIARSVRDLANIYQGGVLRRERDGAQMGAGLRQMVPSLERREALFLAIDKGNLSGLSEMERKAAAAWKGATQDVWKEMNRLGLTDAFEDNYAARLVERGVGNGSILENFLGRHRSASVGVSSPHFKARQFKFVEDLERAGFKLRTKDLAEVAELYFPSVGRAIEGKTFVNALKKLKEEDNGFGGAIRKAGKSAPLDWVPIDSPHLRGSVVHPEIAPHLKWFLEATNPDDIVGAALALMTAQKRLSVSYSFFHRFNLGVAHLGTGGSLKGPFIGLSDIARGHLTKAGVGDGGPIHRALQQFYAGGLGDVVDKLLTAGLRVSPMDEVGVGALERVFGRVGRAAESVQRNVFDKGTWGYAHTGGKLTTAIRAYEGEIAKLKGKGVTPEAEAKIAETAASFANSVYGHIDWYREAMATRTALGRWLAEKLMSPQGRRVSQLMLFAPDWTYSTFNAMRKALPAAERPIGSMEWRLHAGYAFNTALMLLTVQNAVNVQLSGHPIWDKRQKDPFRIQDADGTQWQMFKHSIEYFEWMRNPMHTLANKMSFIPKEAMAQISGREYVGGPPMLDTSLEGRSIQALENLTPFFVHPFFDTSIPLKERAERSALGMAGIQHWGHTDVQRERARELRARDRERRKKE